MRFVHHNRSLLPSLLWLVSIAFYLVASWMAISALAFPLDDSWIHQVYARTLARYGEWGYRPGEPSTGSTAPLWTLFLVPGHWLPIGPILWSHLLGSVLGIGVIWLGARLSYLLFRDQTIAWWSSLALAVEWHLVWAALSGMEIVLYILLALLLFVRYLEAPGKPWQWGLIGGALTLTRPEGILLLALVGAHFLWHARGDPASAVRQALSIAVGWLVIVAPYALFNWSVTGFIFPNTFYAKQQEYAAALSVPAWKRLLRLAWQPWIGGQALLAAALPWLPWRRLGSREWLPLLWAIAIVVLYSLRLPVVYQHGRYLVPTIPIFLLYGIAAVAHTLRRAPAVARRPVAAALMSAFALFIVVGALAYRADVTLIECEMGGAAAWIAANSSEGELIAAHDIGRLGYTGGRPILDFAGLISPEAIPIIRDELALLDMAQQRGARYVVTFADWYPEMVQDPRLTAIFATDCPVTASFGGKPMTIYQIAPP